MITGLKQKSAKSKPNAETPNEKSHEATAISLSRGFEKSVGKKA
jgi:hypothetical protein